MELAEYAMILNNFGFFLERSGQTQDALVVLEEVLRLDPSRMVAHLNIADAYWEASRRTQAREHYLYYHNMMMERDLGDDMPSRVSERISTATDPLPAAQPSLRVLSEESTGFEMDPWNPVRLDGCEVMDDGGLLLLLSRRADPSIIEHGVRDMWAIQLDPDGSIASLESLPRDPGLRLTTSPLLEEDDDLFLIACTDAGDTLWACRLERTDEFCHSAFVTAAEGGGWLVSIDPDAESDESAIYFVSSSGVCVFHARLGYRYLLDSTEEYCETNPVVRAQHMTRSGDILLGGSVCEYMGSPSAWFTCALDGGTGEPLWKATDFGLGDAWILDFTETRGGGLVAVGRTVPREFRDGRFFWSEAPGRPLVVVLGPSGEVLGTEMPDTETAVSFQSICAVPGEEDGYVVAGSDEDGGCLVILRTEITSASPR